VTVICSSRGLEESRTSILNDGQSVVIYRLERVIDQTVFVGFISVVID
jgi:hypothetical protein